MKKIKKNLTVKDIAEYLGEKFIGDGDILIEDVADIANPNRGQITFAVDPRYVKKAEQTDISAIIVPVDVEESTKTIILSSNPRLAFAKLINLFYGPEAINKGIDKTTIIGENFTHGKDVALLSNVVIGDNVKIGDNTVIYPNTVIENNVIIGSDCIIRANVTIYDDTVIGDRVIIHSGSVIGSDGFGYVMDRSKGTLFKITQIGNVVIEDDVEIGSNVSIDRAALGSTVIKKDVKIDNLVQIGHNCSIGEHTTISGQSGLSGSVEIGKYVTIAGQVGFADHISIEDNVIIAAKSGVSKKLKKGKVYWGVPAKELSKVKEEKIIVRQLPKFVKRIKDLEKQIKELEKRLEGK